MHIAGIVAEYNPFHTGHGYQLFATRQALGEDCAVVAVMSGNWVQQADCAVADKWLRARLALLGGVDLVLELPTVYATASAEQFAKGAAGLLEGCGVVDYLSFGSECGQVEPLRAAARCLDSPECQAAIRRRAGMGENFAACRQAAVEERAGRETANLLARPNNNLGVEYIRALNALGSRIHPMTVLRRGAEHGGLVPSRDGACPPAFLSATQIRLDLQQGRWDQAEPYLIPGARPLLEQSASPPPSLSQVSRALLAMVRTMGAEDWARLPDSGAGEGLPRRLERAGRSCTSMEEFFRLAKTRRYTHARLRRLVLRAYLGITGADIPASPSYLRVLGFNLRGQELLGQMKRKAALPILTKPAHARELTAPGRKLFALEARCTDLYDLCRNHIPAPGREWTTGPVILAEEICHAGR